MLNRPISRRALLRGSLMAGAGALAMTTFGNAGVLSRQYFSFAMNEASARQLNSDVDVLNYALTLEYLEAEAYKAINDAGILSGRAATYFRAFGDHERQHVDAIVQTINSLGGTPIAKPAFDFSGVPTGEAAVIEFFQTVEAVGASAYRGAAPSIQNPDILTAALSIHANEAAHAAALADLVAPGTNLFSPDAFGAVRTPAEVLEIVGPWLPASSGSSPNLPMTGGGGMARTNGSGNRGTLR
jgi:hypothetical protein